ncbi:MAG: DUF4433 domain-containing protein [Roseiarcus sp.]|jgi:hypothetical protein
MSKDLLNPEKALIFRIVHRDNMLEILSHGCRCRNTADRARYVEIGNQELIVKRTGRVVPCPPGGTLSDYVPFYFTPYSPMLYNIKTGFNGIQKRPLDEIVILVSSLRFLRENDIPFVFSDRHAFLKTAMFSSDLAHLDRIIWETLQEKNFRRDDLERFEKYQAEALVHKHVPLEALLGAACYNEAAKLALKKDIDSRGLPLKVIAQPTWYL